MDVMMNTAKAGTMGASFFISYLFGEWSVLLGALLFFVSFDFVSGLMAAWHNNNVRAEVGFWGIPKKVMIFGVVALAHIFDKVYLDQIGEPLAIGEFQVSVMAATILYYLVNEFISITENLGKMGMPVPAPLKKAVEAFKDDDYSYGKKEGRK
ncbi:phage holin family protein [Salimicrobium halophilum]|uniref:Toxin secretion/phage lysis holin n=1 Tax=Salimicrobium halophilum TaxID=86666 RepID=A0A1G8WCR1_9BACI|nr:phage holin family protein [Salimicrobium halophilum]SDJ75946.1 toxin secretion/phage lysis holin [Salimicrobium halophilum]